MTHNIYNTQFNFIIHILDQYIDYKDIPNIRLVNKHLNDLYRPIIYLTKYDKNLCKVLTHKIKNADEIVHKYRKKLLNDAVWHNNVYLIKKLNYTCIELENYRALYIAVLRNNLPLFKYFIKLSNLDSSDYIINQACSRGRLEFIKYISLDRSININSTLVKNVLNSCNVELIKYLKIKLRPTDLIYAVNRDSIALFDLIPDLHHLAKKENLWHLTNILKEISLKNRVVIFTKLAAIIDFKQLRHILSDVDIMKYLVQFGRSKLFDLFIQEFALDSDLFKLTVPENIFCYAVYRSLLCMAKRLIKLNVYIKKTNYSQICRVNNAKLLDYLFKHNLIDHSDLRICECYKLSIEIVYILIKYKYPLKSVINYINTDNITIRQAKKFINLGIPFHTLLNDINVSNLNKTHLAKYIIQVTQVTQVTLQDAQVTLQDAQDAQVTLRDARDALAISYLNSTPLNGISSITSEYNLSTSLSDTIIKCCYYGAHNLLAEFISIANIAELKYCLYISCIYARIECIEILVTKAGQSLSVYMNYNFPITYFDRFGFGLRIIDIEYLYDNLRRMCEVNLGFTYIDKMISLGFPVNFETINKIREIAVKCTNATLIEYLDKLDLN